MKKMKCIIVSPVVSHPPLSGNSARINETVTALKSLDIDVTFVLCPTKAMNTRKQSGVMEEVYQDNYKELNNGELCRGTVSMALLGKIKKFVKLGNPRLAQKLHDFIFKDGFIDTKPQKEFEHLVAKIKPDFVLVEYALLSKLIVNLPNHILTMVDTHDRFSDRNQRIRDIGGTGFWLSLSKKQELTLLNRFDKVIAIQKHEGQFFASLLGPQKSKVLTLSILSPPNQTHATDFTESKDIGFIGSSNKHNLEGLKLFLEHQWPKIRQALPDARLLVAGAKYPELNSWESENVDFLGRVDSLDDFYQQCSIIINPCITGSGLKIKSIEAMKHAKSLVTTSEGAEGLEDAETYGLFIKDLTTDSYAMKCIELLTDNDANRQYGMKNSTFIQQSYMTSIKSLDTILTVK